MNSTFAKTEDFKNNSLRSFFVDSKNSLTHKALTELVKGTRWFTFNPVYIYGQSGSGKTHLLRAIVYEMLITGKKVHYTVTKEFCNDYCEAIMNCDLESFRNFYRKIDILALDDIDFLSGKPKTQEEMTNLLIARTENRKLTLFSSRVRPFFLKKFDEWLSSRLRMGLVLEVK